MNDRTLTDLQTMYDAFSREAMEQESGVRLWRGSSIKLYNSIPGFKQSNYTRHRNLLVHSGCVVVEKQGSHHAESRWILVHRPTQDLLDAADTAILKEKHRKENESLAVLRSEIQRLHRQLGGVNVVDALQELEKRIASMERTIERVSNGTA